MPPIAKIYTLLRYALKQKKRYYLGIFPKRRAPPPHPPLLGTPYPKKYEICNMKYEIWNMKYEICNIYHVIVHFLPKKHCFWPKKALFFKFTKVLGFGKTPPPHVGKNSQIISFFFMRAYLIFCVFLVTIFCTKNIQKCYEIYVIII